MTKSIKIADDVSALLRARNPLLWVVTKEEARVERYLIGAASSAGYKTWTWDVAQGVKSWDGKAGPANLNDPGAMFSMIAQRVEDKYTKERSVWIMRDLPIWMQGPPGATPLRQLRNLVRVLPSAGRDNAQAIILISPSADVPAELANHCTVIDWPLPDREEIGQLLDEAIEVLPDEMKATAAPNGKRDAAIDAAIGLSGEEAQACFAKSLVQLRRIDPVAVASEKKRVIAREKVLEYYDPIPGGLDAVGGLESLKAWLVERSMAYSPAARAYGLPLPKGCLLVGVPGCGKSLSAKAIATAWQVPLLRLDLGALKSKFVGESEATLRRALRVVDAVGRCVLWIDEIEKALQGATSGSADGGVATDQLGAVLNWMQERAGGAFIVATSNDVEGLPPELLRKGRFDEMWFVDTPTESERVEILMASLKSFGRSLSQEDAVKVAGYTDGFTGAEIAAIVPDAMFAAFADGQRDVLEGDLLEAAAKVVPLTKTAAEKVERLRKWAASRARNASVADKTAAKKQKGFARVLDIA